MKLINRIKGLHHFYILDKIYYNYFETSIIEFEFVEFLRDENHCKELLIKIADYNSDGKLIYKYDDRFNTTAFPNPDREFATLQEAVNSLIITDILE